MFHRRERQGPRRPLLQCDETALKVTHLCAGGGNTVMNTDKRDDDEKATAAFIEQKGITKLKPVKPSRATFADHVLLHERKRERRFERKPYNRIA
jgi:hypothetical protein